MPGIMIGKAAWNAPECRQVAACGLTAAKILNLPSRPGVRMSRNLPLANGGRKFAVPRHQERAPTRCKTVVVYSECRAGLPMAVEMADYIGGFGPALGILISLPTRIIDAVEKDRCLSHHPGFASCREPRLFAKRLEKRRNRLDRCPKAFCDRGDGATDQAPRAGGPKPVWSTVPGQYGPDETPKEAVEDFPARSAIR